MNSRSTLVEAIDMVQDLNLDYLDLYLLHWPLAFDSYEFGGWLDYPRFRKEWFQCGLATIILLSNVETPVFDETTSIKETWAEMEKLVEDGLVVCEGYTLGFNLSVPIYLPFLEAHWCVKLYASSEGGVRQAV